MTKVYIQKDLCSSCGACAGVCPDGAFQREGDEITLSTQDDCLRCWQCIAVCPTGAVRHKNFPIEECPTINTAELPTQESLILAFRERRSCRKYLDRPVPREMVEVLIDGARWTPSAHNNQDINWIALDDPQRIKALSEAVVSVFSHAGELLRSRSIRLLGPHLLGKARFQTALDSQSSLDALLADAAKGEDVIFYHAPVVLIGHTAAGNDLGRDDAIYQAYNIMLLARRLKMGTCQIGYLTFALNLNVMGLNKPLLRQLNMLEGRTAQVALAVGYPRYHYKRVIPRRLPTLEWNTSLATLPSKSNKGV